VIPFDADNGQLGWLRNIYHRADRIIVHAEDNYRAIVQTFDVPPEQVHVIPMGPYLRFADEHTLPTDQARQRLGIDTSVPVVLFFGQIKRVKGLDHLLNAFSLVTKECPEARLLIAGPEWKEPFEGYADLIRTLGITDKVSTRIEYVPDDEVGVYYSAADVVALPYTEAYQSAVLYMAHSFRRPVVATTVGGIPEVVTDGESGVLVPPSDTNALAEALLTLLQDRDKARAMGECGRSLVETEFGWRDIAVKTAQVYARALDERLALPQS
jgi:glycosyltransferase involved in cell wall biosynthesis